MGGQIQRGALPPIGHIARWDIVLLRYRFDYRVPNRIVRQVVVDLRAFDTSVTQEYLGCLDRVPEDVRTVEAGEVTQRMWAQMQTFEPKPLHAPAPRFFHCWKRHRQAEPRSVQMDVQPRVKRPSLRSPVEMLLHVCFEALQKIHAEAWINPYRFVAERRGIGLRV